MKNRGMSLIEVLVASLLLVISIAAIMMSFAQGQKTVIENSKRFQAKKLLTSWFEQLSLAPDRNEVMNNGDFGIGSYISTPKVKIDTLDGVATTFKIQFTPTVVNITKNNSYTGSNIPSVLMVKGVVTWNQGAKTFSMITGTK